MRPTGAMHDDAMRVHASSSEMRAGGNWHDFITHARARRFRLTRFMRRIDGDAIIYADKIIETFSENQ